MPAKKLGSLGEFEHLVLLAARLEQKGFVS